MSIKTLIWMKPYAIGMRFIAMFRDILKGHPADAFARLRAVLWGIYGFVPMWKKRIKVQKKRKVSDKELLKHFTEKYLYR